MKAIALAALAAFVLAHVSSVSAATPVAVRISLDPPIAGFGDPVTARIVIAVDRRAVNANTLRFTTDLAPLTLLSPARVTRTVSGDVETVSIVQRAACLTAPCVARTLILHPVHVSVSGAVSSPAVQLQLRSRVTAEDLASGTPRFIADVAPPKPSYRVPPNAAAFVLDAIAVLAAAGAALLFALWIRSARRGRRGTESGDELERALRLVREAEARPVPDRRRALALLARLLRSRDATLGLEASRLAWSAPPPEPPAIDALVADVESERAR